MCKECEERGKTWDGDDPVCSFDENGNFKDNWNCATLNKIRDIMIQEDNVHYSFNEKLGVLTYGGLFLVLGWYKNRGRVDSFMIHNNVDYLDMTHLEICEMIITDKINVLSEGE